MRKILVALAIIALIVVSIPVGLIATGTIDSTSVPDPLYVLTGGPFGTTPTAAGTCDDWTSTDPGGGNVQADMGQAQHGYEPGTQCCSGPCGAARHLYCLEE